MLWNGMILVSIFWSRGNCWISSFSLFPVWERKLIGIFLFCVQFWHSSDQDEFYLQLFCQLLHKFEMGKTQPLSDLRRSILHKAFRFEIKKLLLWEVEFTFLSTVSFFLFFFSAERIWNHWQGSANREELFSSTLQNEDFCPWWGHRQIKVLVLCFQT